MSYKDHSYLIVNSELLLFQSASPDDMFARL